MENIKSDENSSGELEELSLITNMTPKKCPNECGTNFDDDNSISLSKEEIIFLQNSFIRAASVVDVGAELVIRLLNDKRSLFKALLESHCGAMEVDRFTVEIVNRDFNRAKEVGDGVVRFFTKVMEVLPDYDASAKIRDMSVKLGVLHYRMRVWFQAENWLSVKNSLLEVVVDLADSKASSSGFLRRCSGNNTATISTLNKNGQRKAWTKLVQFVIRNMKRGFLSEALGSEKQSIPRDPSCSPCSGSSC